MSSIRHFINLVESSQTMRPSSQDIENIKKIREEIRAEEGGGGYCHWVSEWIENKFGWPREAGTYLHSDGRIIIGDGHLWNRLPDGAILDATADQLGEGNDIRIIEPNDPDIKRYRLAWNNDYNPHLHQSYPELKGIKWDGIEDWKKQNDHKDQYGKEWWVTDKEQYKKYHDQQKKYAKMKESHLLENTIAESLLYRWVDEKMAINYVKTNTMKAQFNHFIPKGLDKKQNKSKFIKGISFGYNENKWRGAGDICFVMNKHKIFNNIININGQSVYELGQIMRAWKDFGIFPDSNHLKLSISDALNDSLSTPTEAFVIGNLLNISECIETIILKKITTSNMVILNKFASQYNISLIN